MGDKEALKAQIRKAFSENEYPGDWCLRGSDEGNEPFAVEEEFKGKHDWRSLTPDFLDQAPNGLGSALSFFSDEAFRFYLPAYLIADIDSLVSSADPLFHLCHGLADAMRNEYVNVRRYGCRTWFDEGRYKFAMFTQTEVEAIVAYLKYKLDSDDVVDEEIEQALRNYWLPRVLGVCPECGTPTEPKP